MLKDEILLDLQKDEGMRSVVYDDATGKPLRPGDTIKGHPTIGIGRCIDLHGITQDEMIYLCNNDINQLLQWCNIHLTYWQQLNDTRQRAIANMIFQLGFTNFLAFHELDVALKSQNWQNAHDAVINSHYHLQAPDRSTRIANWILTGNAL